MKPFTPLFIIAFGLCASLVRAEPQVLASIKPLQLIAQAVLGDSARADVLLPPGMDTHHYSLRPSDLSRLGDAPVVLWLGGDVEPYLEKVIQARGDTLDASAVSSHYQADDVHLWMSYRNAIDIAHALVARLIAINPALAQEYRRNLKRFEESLRVLEAQTRLDLASGVAPYLVYHDAYGYFEREYGLRHRAQITTHHELKPSARQLLKLRRLVRKEGVQCVLTLPGTPSGVLKLLAEDAPLKVAELDPQAGDVESTPQAYAQWLAQVAAIMKKCTARVS